MTLGNTPPLKLIDFPASLKTTNGVLSKIDNFDDAWDILNSAHEKLNVWKDDCKCCYIGGQIYDGFNTAWDWLYDDYQGMCSGLGDALFTLLETNNRQIKKKEKDNIVALSRMLFDFADCHIYDYEEL